MIFLMGYTRSHEQRWLHICRSWKSKGRISRRPYADSVTGKIRELRIHHSSNQYRVLYFFHVRDQIVVVHAFFKKTQQVRRKDIDLAEKRMEDWMRRFPEGGEI
ncbi:MAG: type II toxin-antitoxin system RelE/ParE family toxin [Syntrophales bacterium]